MATVTAPPLIKTSPIADRGCRVPLGIALALYGAITAAVFFASFRAADHHFVFALDDPYIAMAMARSLALHGTWGVTRFAFSSASSSPLFTLILAFLYRLTGVHEITSLVVSWTAGAFAIYLADRFLREHLNWRLRVVTLTIFVVATPLFVIGLLGMEHTLHLALALAFVSGFDKASDSPRRLFAITALMVGARYESLFLVGAAAILFATQRKWRPMFWMIGGAALTVAAYGAFAMSHGSYFLPNSVALKGTGLMGWLAPILVIMKIIIAPHLAILLLALSISAIALRRSQPRLAQLALLLAIAGTGHLIFARTGGAFRYEAYFVALSCLVLAITAARWSDFATRPRSLFLVAMLAAACLLAVRSGKAALAFPGYSRAIYQEQMQSARFLRTYFPSSSVAANDIGAISFFTDIQCTDLVGLADDKIFFAKRAGLYTTDFLRLEAAANHVQIAVVYDSWSTEPGGYWKIPPLPSEWVRIAKLQVPHSEILGGDVVSFYAVDPSTIAPLRSALHRFGPTLPAADRLTFQY
ncbi:MAG: hypothetical protein JOY95_03535 [Silvibacterium sp.]|nr:hypothetical protein [Silvibacterium sp.]